MDNKLERLIKLQTDLQTETYGYDFFKMSRADAIRYLRDQHQAITVEVSELLNEVDWKPWTDGSRLAYDRDALVGELIDVLHFWLNMWIAVSSRHSPQEIADEIFTRFAIKNRTNAQRKADGYDGVSTKCPLCRRALDDVAVQCNATKVDNPPNPVLDGYCASKDTFYYWITTVGESGKIDEQVVISWNPPVTCDYCKQDVDKNGCQPPTTSRWGYCMNGVSSPRNIPPVGIATS